MHVTIARLRFSHSAAVKFGRFTSSGCCPVAQPFCIDLDTHNYGQLRAWQEIRTPNLNTPSEPDNTIPVPAFVAQSWQDLCKLMAICQSIGSTHHPLLAPAIWSIRTSRYLWRRCVTTRQCMYDLCVVANDYRSRDCKCNVRRSRTGISQPCASKLRQIPTPQHGDFDCMGRPGHLDGFLLTLQ